MFEPQFLHPKNLGTAVCFPHGPCEEGMKYAEFLSSSGDLTPAPCEMGHGLPLPRGG